MSATSWLMWLLQASSASSHTAGWKAARMAEKKGDGGGEEERHSRSSSLSSSARLVGQGGGSGQGAGVKAHGEVRLVCAWGGVTGGYLATQPAASCSPLRAAWSRSAASASLQGGSGSGSLMDSEMSSSRMKASPSSWDDSRRGNCRHTTAA